MKQVKKQNIPGLVLENVKIDDLIASLQSIKEKYSDYHDITIEEESYYGGGYRYDLVGYRLETDEEEQSRINREKEWADQRTKQERLQYEKLKAKFEPS